MDKRIASIILAIVLALIPCLPALAEGNNTVTITMATEKDIDITLDKADWKIGDVEPNTEYYTESKKTWCTITNSGNCVVEIRVKGEDAVWVGGSSYTWELSSDNTTAKGKYALWYHIAYDDADSYTSITTTDTQMKKANGDVIELVGNDAQKQFGLKLLTPSSDFTVDGVGHFFRSKQMQTTITISAVAP